MTDAVWLTLACAGIVTYSGAISAAMVKSTLNDAQWPRWQIGFLIGTLVNASLLCSAAVVVWAILHVRIA